MTQILIGQIFFSLFSLFSHLGARISGKGGRIRGSLLESEGGKRRGVKTMSQWWESFVRKEKKA